MQAGILNTVCVATEPQLRESFHEFISDTALALFPTEASF